jgi:regulator of nucleoside diphosphate kinase
MRNRMTKEMKVSEAAILLSADDRDRLTDLAKTTLVHYPADDAQLLLEELDRADIVPMGRIPAGVVMMNSFVEFRDDRKGTIRRVQLVYPTMADIKKGRISILSLVGTALIGLAEDQSITCRTANGREVRLTVLRASTEPLDDESFQAGGARTITPSHDPTQLSTATHKLTD